MGCRFSVPVASSDRALAVATNPSHGRESLPKDVISKVGGYLLEIGNVDDYRSLARSSHKAVEALTSPFMKNQHLLAQIRNPPALSPVALREIAHYDLDEFTTTGDRLLEMATERGFGRIVNESAQIRIREFLTDDRAISAFDDFSGVNLLGDIMYYGVEDNIGDDQVRIPRDLYIRAQHISAEIDW